jgi:hypothetical protein
MTGTMVYVAVAVPLSVIPALKALALSVAVEVSGNGLWYCEELEVGSRPSLVYRMTAPEVAQLMETLTGPGNVPCPGLKVGVATGA